MAVTPRATGSTSYRAAQRTLIVSASRHDRHNLLTRGADFENEREAQDVAVRLCEVKRAGVYTLRFAK